MYDNKRKILTALIVAALIFSLFTIYVYSAQRGLSAKAAALYVPETESFLYLKNENERLAMASTTKIMTALIALETLEAEKIIEIPRDAVGIEGSSLYLNEGELLSAEDLIYGLMLGSANDAAAALAIEISGSIEDFALLMNARARDLGLTDTNFKNPHGLDDKEHYTTAHDLAIISAVALKNEAFKKIASTYKRVIESSDKTRVVVNHNKLLKSYDGCIGVKTGYTKKSGRSLVSAAERDGLMLVAVTIDAPDDWRDHTALLDYGYSTLERLRLATSGEFKYEVPIIGGEAESVTASNKDELYKIFKKGEGEYEFEVKLCRPVIAPISKNDKLGEVIFTQNGEEIARIPLTADEFVNKRVKKGFFSIFRKG